MTQTMQATPDLANVISTKLQSLMETRDQISQRELAKAMDVNFMTLNRVIRGEGTPTVEICIKIANYYGISTDELLGLTAAKATRKRRIAS